MSHLYTRYSRVEILEKLKIYRDNYEKDPCKFWNTQVELAKECLKRHDSGEVITRFDLL